MDETTNRRWRLRLVEVGVVIIVFGALAALVVSAVQKAREAERRHQCSNNLKQICLSLLNYEHNNHTFPPAMICDKGEDPALTDVFRPNWAVILLPYLEAQMEEKGFDYKVPISHENNRLERRITLPIFLCPTDAVNNRRPFAGNSEAEGRDWARSNYACNAGNVFIGKDGVMDASSPQWKDNFRRGVMAVNDATMDLAGITDGTSNTILVGEIRAGVTEKDRRGVWAMGMAGSSIACAHGSWGDDNGPNPCFPCGDDIKGADQIQVGPAPEDHCMDAWGKSGSRQATFRSLHPDGCNIVFADNSVHFINNIIETSGPWGDPSPDLWPTWDRLICSGDGGQVDARRVTLTNGQKPEEVRKEAQEKAQAEGKRKRLHSGDLKVRGTVRFKGGKAPEGQYRFIALHPDQATIEAEKATFGYVKGAGGEIKPDGRFEMTTIKPGDGVLPGRYKVTIRCLANYADPNSLTIPKKYADASTTPLEVTIAKARNDLVFELDK